MSDKPVDMINNNGLMRYMSSCQEDEIMPVKFDDRSLIWVAADQPLKDTSFLSTKILAHCGDLPIFWLHPTYPKGSSPLTLGYHIV